MWWGVNFSVFVNSDLYRVIDLRICCLDRLSCVWVIKNGLMFRVVKFYGFLIIGVMGVIVCRFGS